jgi:hypothetical protein
MKLNGAFNMLNPNDQKLWQDLLNAENRRLEARVNFMEQCSNRHEVLRNALREPGERYVALGIIEFLTVDEKKLLFPEVLGIASWLHGQTHKGQEIILSMPREWVLANIESAAEPLLGINDEEEYRAMMSLFELLDLNLAHRLAQRCLKSKIYDIHRTGEWFFERHPDMKQ